MLSVLVLAAAVMVTHLLPPRQELIPQRAEFGDMPLQIGEWQGQREQMESIYIDALKFTDYALINFRNPQGAVVNFYTAYYASQRKGESVHSPRSCLPGGGWEIQSITQLPIADAAVSGVPLLVNRVLISHGDEKQLVYYWFQQRGRVMTNEFLVKWYMLVDALLRQRTDGALVRLIMPLRPGEDISALDQQLGQFAARLAPVLPAFIPD
jgi:EpsI family protein